MADPAFAPVVALAGPPRWRRVRVDQRFDRLIRTITAQLLATSAAATIHRRVVEACGDAVNPESVMGAGVDRLRAAGLSRVKAEAMVELAERVDDGRLRLDRHGRRSDDEVAAEITAVRGLGPWTAHMYLLGTLARPDVWPVGDFGVRHGWSLVHGLDEPITAAELAKAGEPFAGVRSAVAWYCWQAVHLDRDLR